MKIRLGTRKSKLAIAQARRVRAMLEKKGHTVELITSTSLGDKNLKAKLTSFRGKGVFTSNLEYQLLAGDIDIAVHSLKDLPVELSPEFEIAAYIKRDNASDTLLIRKNKVKSLQPLVLEDTAVIATGSMRRQLQLLNQFPQVKVVDIRGNVNTRISRLTTSFIDGLVMASAVFERLKLKIPDTHYSIRLPITSNPGAPAQGIIAVETLAGKYTEVREINDRPTQKIAEVERGVLAKLGGACEIGLGLNIVPQNAGYVAYMTAVHPSFSWKQAVHLTQLQVYHTSLNELGNQLILPAPTTTTLGLKVFLGTDDATAQSYSQLLQQNGCTVFNEAVFAYNIHYEKIPAVKHLWEQTEWLIISSKRAAKFCYAITSEIPRSDLRIAVVGNNTAKYMREYGFAVHLIADSINALEPMFEEARKIYPGKALYLSGEHIIKELENVDRVVVYTATLKAVNFNLPVDIAVAFSPRSALHLMKFITTNKWVAIGSTTAKALVEPLIAPTPTPEGVLQAIMERDED